MKMRVKTVVKTPKMPPLDFIKNLILFPVTINFNIGRDKKIEVKSGKNGINVLSSPLDTKAIDLSKNSPRLQNKRADKKNKMKQLYKL